MKAPSFARQSQIGFKLGRNAQLVSGLAKTWLLFLVGNPLLPFF
jgi:hypothetical protein